MREASDSDRTGFIRKVYGILSAQLAFTIAISATITLNDFVRSAFLGFVLRWPSVFTWGLLIGTLVMLGLLHVYKQEVPTNYYLLAGFSFLNALNLSVVLCRIHEEFHERGDVMILQAAGITLAMFLALTMYTFWSGKKFSFLGAYVRTALWSSLAMGIAFLFFDVHAFGIFAWLSALIFCGFIVYDTWKVSKVFGPDDYIPAVIELYLDVINLFLDVLRIIIDINKKLNEE